VAGLSSRLDGIDQDVRTVQQSVSDLNGSINKLQQQMNDLSKAVSILQAPAPPPPAANAATGSGGGGAPVAGVTPPAEAPCAPASQLYPNGNSDRQGGNYDLALKEYADYLRCFGNLPLAPNAQFYIGVIHSLQGDNQAAVQDFDAVLEKYPDNNKTADALFAKGLALVKLGRLTDGGSEFGEVIKRFSQKNPDLAAQACDQRKKLGLNCGTSRSPGKKK
jgi:TolA-binding protein